MGELGTPETIYIEDKRPDARPGSNFTGNYPEPLVRSIVQSAVARGVDPNWALSIGLQESQLLRNPDAMNLGQITNLKIPFDTRAENLWTDYRYSPDTTERREMLDEIQGEVGEPEYGDTFPLQDPNLGSNTNYTQTQAYKDLTAEDKVARYAMEADDLANAMVEKFAHARSKYGASVPRDLMLQAYNTLANGWTEPGEYNNPGRLHFVNDRPYGKRILSLSQYTMKPNRDIQGIIQEETWRHHNAKRKRSSM